MQHKNQSELEFPYRFPLQDRCCEAGHPDASVMSTENGSIFAGQVQNKTLTVCNFWKRALNIFHFLNSSKDIQIFLFILKSSL